MANAARITEFMETHLDAGSHAHYAALMTPLETRLATAAVLAFEAQMRALPAVKADLAPVKLRWWHEELERLAAREPRHPITTALNAIAGAPLVAALNSLLHGAVMDFNAVEIKTSELERYFYMRSGALYEALAIAAGAAGTSDHAAAAGVTSAVADILREARDPRAAQVPAANLAPAAGSAGDDDGLQAFLVERRDAAVTALGRAPVAGVAGTVRLALYKRDWPRIMATPYGATPRPLSPVTKLWIAWRAARHYQKSGAPV